MRILISIASVESQPSADNPNYKSITVTSLKSIKNKSNKCRKFVTKFRRKLPRAVILDAELSMPRAERSGTAYEMPY